MTVVEVKSNNSEFAIELSTMCTDCDILYKKWQNRSKWRAY